MFYPLSVVLGPLGASAEDQDIDKIVLNIQCHVKRSFQTGKHNKDKFQMISFAECFFYTAAKQKAFQFLYIQGLNETVTTQPLDLINLSGKSLYSSFFNCYKFMTSLKENIKASSLCNCLFLFCRFLTVNYSENCANQVVNITQSMLVFAFPLKTTVCMNKMIASSLVSGQLLRLCSLSTIGCDSFSVYSHKSL